MSETPRFKEPLSLTENPFPNRYTAPMGLCGSKPAPQDERPVARSAPVTQATPTHNPATVTMATPQPQQLASAPSASSSRSRPRSRTPSLHHSTHHGAEGSESIPRNRTLSAPQKVQRSSSLDRKRSHTLAHGKAGDSVPRLPHPGESGTWLGYGYQ